VRSARSGIIDDCLTLSIEDLVPLLVDQHAITTRISLEPVIRTDRSTQGAARNGPDHRTSDRITSYGFACQATKGRTPSRAYHDAIGSIVAAARPRNASG